MVRNLLLGAAVLLAHGSAALAAEGGEAGWSLRLPSKELVAFRGKVNFDKAGHGSGAMMYPAPGLAGFIAAIATHATIVNATREGQKTDIEIAADKVLQPFSETLASFRYSELLGNALALREPASLKLVAADARPAAGWVVDSMPVLYMTQDKSALILDNTVAVYKAGAGEQPAYQNTVRVVSSPSEAQDLVAYWQQNGGKLLKEESARLVRMSLDIALEHAAAPAAPAATPSAQRTIRYLEGKSEVVERAQLLDDQCERALIRNLRGWLMSIPLKRPIAPDCKTAAGG